MTKETNYWYSNLSSFNLDIQKIVNAQINSPDSFDIIFDSAFILYKTGHIQPAKSLLESLISTIQNQTNQINNLGKIYLLFANINFYEKKYHECISILNKYLSINNLCCDAWFLIGKSYRNLNLEIQMIDSYFRGLNIDCDLRIASELSQEIARISNKDKSQGELLFNKLQKTLSDYHSQLSFNLDWFVQNVKNKTVQIPKIIHRVWLGQNPIPKIYEDYFDNWKKLHPEWSFYTWSDEDIKNFITYDKIQEANTYAGQADIARYEILYRYGGIYLDCDINLLKSLNFLIEETSHKLIVCNEDESFNSYCSIGFIASIPGFYCLYDALIRLKSIDVNCYQPNISTGPFFFRQCIGYDLSETKLIPVNSFYPYSYNEPSEILNLLDLSEVYGIHVWAASWMEQKDSTSQLNIEHLLAAYISRLQRIKDDIYFVVIGANDGVSNDSLAYFIMNNNWQGVFVEPLPDIFLKLVLNYYQFQNRLKFENSAISDISVSSTISRVKPIAVQKGDVPNWAYGVASLHKDRNAIGGYSSGKLLEHKMDELTYKNIENNTVCQDIRCITFQDLVEKYEITEIDVLQIDCEGHDYSIFQQIDLSIFQPYFIKIEICNLTKTEFEWTVNKLISYSYIIYKTPTDLYCFKQLKVHKKYNSQLNFSSRETLEKTLQLKSINIIIFPDWSQNEETLGTELAKIFMEVANHLNRDRVTILIDTTNISEEDAKTFLSGIALNLMMEQEQGIIENLTISLIESFSSKQWAALLPYLQTRVVITHENKQAVAVAKADKINACTPSTIKAIISNFNCNSDDEKS